MTRPLRAVVKHHVRFVRGGLLGPDTSRRVGMYELTLECGHRVERFVKYAPNTQMGRANGWHPRPYDDILPPPVRARCDYCAE